MTLNFVLCSDENFVVPALICITSLLENNKDIPCKVTVLTEGLSEDSITKLKKLGKHYSQTVNIEKIQGKIFDDLITYGRYPKSMYFRFLLPEILKDADRVLYLDCDIMVRRPLSKLFEEDINDFSCAAVIDQQCDDIQIYNRLRIDTPYFNSGVMLMNLKEWRDKHYTQKIIDFIQKNPDKCIYPDQDALNVVLSGTVKYLSLGYNLQEMWLTMLDYARFSFHRYPELEDAKKNPYIIHFCVGDKPWFLECKNPYKDEYLKIANRHKFIGFSPRSHYSWPYHRIEAEKLRLERWQKKFIKK